MRVINRIIEAIYRVPLYEDESNLIQRKRNYLIFSSIIFMLSNLYFYYIFNFEYERNSKIEVVRIFMQSSLLFTLFSPFIYTITKRFFIFSNIYFANVYIYVATLIFTVGGIEAPGLFWIVATPIFAATILGQRTAIFSALLVYITLIVFYYLDQAGITFGIQEGLDMKIERVRNIILFSFFFGAIFIYYLIQEEKNDRLQKEQKHKIDSLLKLIIHDFATPLSIISINVDNIKNANNEQQKEEFSARIQRNTTNMLDMIQQIRSLKALKDGKYNIEVEELDLCPLIQASIENLEEKAKNKNLEIKYHNHCDKKVLGVPTILTGQIFNNLLTNAIKFSESTGKIEIHCTPADKYVDVTVTDHGIGMPKEIMEKVFRINEKTSRRGTAGESGTGYGMPIVYEFVKAMGGDVFIKSTQKTDTSDQHGTQVTIRLLQAPLTSES